MSRARIALCVLATAIAGLASRALPPVARIAGKYPGDVLYAVLLYWLIRFFAPKPAREKAALAAFAAASLVEFSKLWQANWLLALRQTRLGGLLLGHKFLWADLVCYAAGALLAYILDRALGGPREETAS